MPSQDKSLLMSRVEDTLKPRMFANLLEEATSEIRYILDDFEVTHNADVSDVSTDNLLQTFLDAKSAGGRSAKTITRYEYIITRFLRHAGIRTRDVTTPAVREYFRSEQDRGVADSTIEGIRQVLNDYFGWLKQEDLIRTNPVFSIDPIKVQKKVRESFSEVDMERIKRACTSARDVALVNFFFSTGCRVSEVVGLNRSDVNFELGECVVLGKGNKQRTVYINDVAALTLKEYLASRTDVNEALFLNHHGKRLLAGGVRDVLCRLAQSSGVSNIHPHRFRRTMITYLLNRGMPIQDVALLAGHDKIDTTMRYYHSSKARIKNSYQRYML